MIIRQLSLTNFRNFSKLDIDLPPHISVIQGENAQGKSNLLEAIYFLSTSRSPRSGNDIELINWSTFDDELPVSRLVADVQKTDVNLNLEIALRAVSRTSEAASALTQKTGSSKSIHKRIRINGVVRRAIDLIGQINVVPFSVLDINIIGGEPSLRRRYLDISISQIDRDYLRQLQRYNRVLWQRNRLLRQIYENQALPDEISFWDDELIKSGAYIISRRQQTLASLEYAAQTIHDELSGNQQLLSFSYIRSIDKAVRPDDSPVEDIAGIFSRSLEAVRDKELAQGISLIGPHRDDLRFLTNNVDTGIYGSRGQQRTMALSLRLAEAEFMRNETGDAPVLLLDDVLSELDYHRRNHLLRHIGGYQQVLMTTTDLDYLDLDFLNNANLFKITQGNIQPLST